MESVANRPAGRLRSIVMEQCPHCRNSKVFQPSKGLFTMPEMKVACDKCGYKFDREPGYFLGAMYISYGMAVMLAVFIFLLFYFGFPNLPLVYTPLAMTLGILLMAKKNFKLSRIIYIHIFPW